MCTDADVCLKELEINDKLAIAVSRTHAATILSKQKLFCFERPQHIYSYSISLLVRNHQLLARINALIERILEAGLLQKWAKECNVPHKYEHEMTEIIPLKINHVAGGLFIYAILVIFSVLAFFFELFVYKKSNSPQATRFWKLTSKFIDGKRYFTFIAKEFDFNGMERSTIHRAIHGYLFQRDICVRNNGNIGRLSHDHA